MRQQLQGVSPNTDETLRGVGTGGPRPPPLLGSGPAPFHIPGVGRTVSAPAPAGCYRGEEGPQGSEGRGARSWSHRYRAAGQESLGVHLRRSGHRGSDRGEKQGGGTEVTHLSHTWRDGGPAFGDLSWVGLDPQIRSSLRGVLVTEVTCPPVS